MGRGPRLIVGAMILALAACSDPVEPTQPGPIVPNPGPSPTPTPPPSPPAAPTGMIAFVSERDGNREIYTANVDGTDIRRLTNDPAYDVDPVWSPDGKRIAFASSRDETNPTTVGFDIFIMNADGSNVVRRTTSGMSNSPAWSPDGSRIAFVGGRSGGYSGIYVMSADANGQAPVMIGFPNDWESDPTWSPDGTKVMFTSRGDYTGGLFIANADGSAIKPVYAQANGFPSTYSVSTRPAWAPDGNRIAIVNCMPFPCFESGVLQIIKTDGALIRTFKSVNRFPRLTWSPDGKMFAFAEDCAPFGADSNCRRSISIQYLRADGTGGGTLFQDAFNPAWRPDPGAIPSAPPVPAPAAVIASDPVASSGDAFVSARPQTFQNAARMTLRNATTGGAVIPAALINGGTDPVRIAASAGDDIALTMLTDEGATVGVYSVTVPPKKPPRVVRTSPSKGKTDVALSVQIEIIFTEPVDRSTVTSSTFRVTLNGIAVPGTISVSSDGLAATFTPAHPLERNSPYVVEITTGIRDLDGDQLEEAEVAGFTTANPPAGTIAFVSNRDGNPEIYTINTDGSGLRRLTNNPAADIDPSWSPDGRRIVFTSDREGSSRIFEMDADGSNVVRRVEGLTPTWSPDGKVIAYAASTPEGVLAIKLARTDGGWSETASITPAQYAYSWQPSWSPDGKQIVFASNNQGWDDESNINVANSDGSGLKIVLRMTADFRSYDSGEIYFQPAFSPDGKKIAFVVCHFAPHDCYPYSNVSLMNADGSGLTVLRFAGGNAHPTWSPNGEFIAYASAYCGICRSTIRYARAGDPTLVIENDVLVEDGYSPAWKPVP